MKCERCGAGADEDCDGVPLCEVCVVLILKEWRIRKCDFDELVKS